MTRQPFPALIDERDYYQILNLPSTSTTGAPISLSKQQLKLAYHRALLQNHPDKAGPAVVTDGSAAAAGAFTSTSLSLDRASIPTSSTDQQQRQRRQRRIYTIDEITTAYKTLSDPSLRAEYDRILRLDRTRGFAVHGEQDAGDILFRTGLEVVDLADLNVEEDTGEEADRRDDSGGMAWYRGCRCGDERGFRVTETELEREAEHGEIVVGCRGCSLWMKVLFAVEDG